LLSESRQIFKSEPSKAFDYIESALELSLQRKDKNAEANCYLTLAELNAQLELNNNAISNYKKAEKLYKKLNNNSALLTCYEGLGKTYELIGDYTSAQDYNNKYLALSRTQNSKKDIVKANKRRASSNAKMKNYEASIEDYETVKKEEQSLNNAQGVIEVNNKIGEILLEQSNEEEALEYFEEAQEIAEEMEDEKSIAQSYSNIGDVYRSKKEYEKELEVRQKSVDLNTKTDNIDALTDNNLDIAEVYIETDQPEEAIPYLERSLEYSDAIGSIEKKSKAQQSLSKALAKSGNYSKAMDSYNTYVVLKDSLLNMKEQEILAKLEINTLVLEKQQRIDLLEKNEALRENEILILKQEQEIRAENMRNQRIIIYSLSAFVLLLIGSSVLILRSSRQKRIANQMLALKSLRSQMNPHFIFNALNSVNSFISTSNERAANKYLSEFSRLMRLVLDNSEHNFIPLSSEISMLKLYLNLEHLRFTEKFDYRFDVSEDLDVDSFEIPPMLVQPYIENAIWHGLRYKKEKGFLSVEMKEEKGDLKIIIEDDGIGRKASQELKTANQKAKTSTGIKNISNRLEVLNRTYHINIKAEIIDIDDESKTGTLVVIRVPVKG
jgi:tetratricopeptide (TPR) repeat protein